MKPTVNKNIILSLIASLFMLHGTSSAQAFPNGGMEDWENATIFGSSIDYPDGYYVSEFLAAYFGHPSGSVQKSSDARSGSHSLHLTNKVDSLGAYVANGKMGISPFLSNLGSSWGGNRPNKLIGYTKKNLMGADSVHISVLLYNTHTPIGGAHYAVPVGTSTSSWTKFEVDFEYFTTIDPDSIVILINIGESFSSPGSVTVGSEIWLDDLSFDIGSGINIPMFSNFQLKAFPNPAGESLNLQLEKGSLEPGMQIEILDVLGRTTSVRKDMTSNKINLDLIELERGNYFYRLLNPDGSTATAGKFTKS